MYSRELSFEHFYRSDSVALLQSIVILPSFLTHSCGPLYDHLLFLTHILAGLNQGVWGKECGIDLHCQTQCKIGQCLSTTIRLWNLCKLFFHEKTGSFQPYSIYIISSLCMIKDRCLKWKSCPIQIVYVHRVLNLSNNCVKVWHSMHSVQL